MKLPKKVNICGHYWKVIVCEMPTGIEGLSQFPDRIIQLSKALRGPMVHLVLLHEIRHAYQFECGMTQVLGDQAMEIDAEMFVSLVTSLKKQKII